MASGFAEDFERVIQRFPSSPQAAEARGILRSKLRSFRVPAIAVLDLETTIDSTSVSSEDLRQMLLRQLGDRARLVMSQGEPPAPAKLRVALTIEGLEGEYGLMKQKHTTGAYAHGTVTLAHTNGASFSRRFSHRFSPPFSIKVQAWVPAGSPNMPVFGGMWTGVTPYKEAFTNAVQPAFSKLVQELYGPYPADWYDGD